MGKLHTCMNCTTDITRQENEFKSSQCLKIIEKVAFSIASEASYFYILSGQKFIKNAKNGQIWRVFEDLKLVVKQCYQTGHFQKYKIGGKCQC